MKNPRGRVFRSGKRVQVRSHSRYWPLPKRPSVFFGQVYGRGGDDFYLVQAESIQRATTKLLKVAQLRKGERYYITPLRVNQIIAMFNESLTAKGVVQLFA